MSLYCPHIRERFTIRGQCAECAPILHKELEQRFAYMDELEKVFMRATGKRALDDWYEFEKFLEQRHQNAT